MHSTDSRLCEWVKNFSFFFVIHNNTILYYQDGPSWVLKIVKNLWAVRAPPRTPLGSSQRSLPQTSDVVWDRRSYDKSGLRPKKIGLGLSLGLAGFMLCWKIQSCHARRHNDLGGHSSFSSTIYIFNTGVFCAWNITTVEINSGVHLLKSEVRQVTQVPLFTSGGLIIIIIKTVYNAQIVNG